MGKRKAVEARDKNSRKRRSGKDDDDDDDDDAGSGLYAALRGLVR